MKKISVILAAFALAMTMSQCKKNEGQPTSNDEVVTITLDVKNNDNSKVVVNTATGTVGFETGDKIYVGSGGKYVGFLTHNGTNFSGNITNPTENQTLQFYFLGNVTPQETLSAGTTEECSVIISDQTEHLPVISCAASNENYVSGLTSYTGHLLNKCALVKFNVTTPSNSPICVTGMKNKVTVDFTQNTMTPSMDGRGVIMLPAGSGENVEKWAILLPQEELEEGGEGSVYSEDGVYSGTRPEISEIAINGYYSDGIGLNISNRTFPEGAIKGLFTINNNGDQVYFSKGNLQYIGSVSTPYWKFADNQWEILGTTTGQNSTSQNVDRDLFGWGTSGYHDSSDPYNIHYQPWSSSTIGPESNPYNDFGYGPSINMPSPNLTESSANYDWGVYNSISNGGNVPNLWRTMSQEEWMYVINTRNTISGIRYAKAIVNEVSGVIILPDDWVESNFSLNNTNMAGASYNSNTITALEWENLFESNGAILLPAAGCRVGSSVDVRAFGIYYTSSYYNSSISYQLWFSESVLYNATQYGRCNACSVRLVQNYNP